MNDLSLEDLWAADPPGPRPHFDLACLDGLPEPAQRYLSHAIAPGSPLASAARLQMHGEIKLGHEWHAFDAEQVLRAHRGFVWRAHTKLLGLPVSGFDRLVDGEGAMRWKLLGLVPVVTAGGPDVTRSAIGRAQLESVWLPSSLIGAGVTWSAPDDRHLGVELGVADDDGHIELEIDERGALRSAWTRRWGNPEEAAGGPPGFHEHPFGVLATEQRTFGDVTIPSALRVGWYFGTPRFEPQGEFFRVTVDDVQLR